MDFPNNWHAFLDDYSFKDSQEIYTNGSNLISTFRVEQLIEHYFLNSCAECQEAYKKVNNFSSEEKSDIKPDDNIGSWYDITHNYTLEEVMEALKMRRQAYWILSPFQNEEENANDNYNYECSNCGYGDVHAKSTHVPYCWHCGAEIEDNNNG